MNFHFFCQMTSALVLEEGELNICSDMSLINCGDWRLYCIVIFSGLFFLNSIFQFIKTMIEAPTARFGDFIPIILFWFCVSVNPLLCLTQYLSPEGNLVSFEIVIYSIIRPFSIIIPYIVVSYLLLQFMSRVTRSGALKYRPYLRALSILNYIFIGIFIITIILVYTIPADIMGNLLIYGTNSLYAIAFLIFITVSAMSLIDFYETGLTELPTGFITVLLIGLNTLAVFQLVYLFSQMIWTWYIHSIGTTYSAIFRNQGVGTLSYAFYFEVFGLLFPNFILSLGVIGLRMLPDVNVYMSSDAATPVIFGNVE